MLKNPFLNNSLVNKYQNLISQINTLEDELKILTDSELRAKSFKLKKQYEANQNLKLINRRIICINKRSRFTDTRIKTF